MEPSSYVLEFEKPLRELSRQLDELRQRSIETNVDLSSEARAMELKIEATRKEIYSSLTPWQKVQIARHPRRPYALDYIGAICEGFQEFHGDRQFRDDRAIIGGPARINGRAVMIVGQQRGRETRERLERNFGSPHPEGYRKAHRLFQMAAKFGLPVVTMMDTPGASPGLADEERGQGWALAANLATLATLPVPIVCVVVGEGNSGGALAIEIGRAHV